MEGKVTINQFSQLRLRISSDKSKYLESFLLRFKKPIHLLWNSHILRPIFRDFRGSKPILMGGMHPLFYIWKFPSVSQKIDLQGVLKIIRCLVKATNR